MMIQIAAILAALIGGLLAGYWIGRDVESQKSFEYLRRMREVQARRFLDQ